MARSNCLELSPALKTAACRVCIKRGAITPEFVAAFRHAAARRALMGKGLAKYASIIPEVMEGAEDVAKDVPGIGRLLGRGAETAEQFGADASRFGPAESAPQAAPFMGRWLGRGSKALETTGSLGKGAYREAFGGAANPLRFLAGTRPAERLFAGEAGQSVGRQVLAGSRQAAKTLFAPNLPFLSRPAEVDALPRLFDRTRAGMATGLRLAGAGVTGYSGYTAGRYLANGMGQETAYNVNSRLPPAMRLSPAEQANLGDTITHKGVYLGIRGAISNFPGLGFIAGDRSIRYPGQNQPVDVMNLPSDPLEAAAVLTGRQTGRQQLGYALSQASRNHPVLARVSEALRSLSPAGLAFNLGAHEIKTDQAPDTAGAFSRNLVDQLLNSPRWRVTRNILQTTDPETYAKIERLEANLRQQAPQLTGAEIQQLSEYVSPEYQAAAHTFGPLDHTIANSIPDNVNPQQALEAIRRVGQFTDGPLDATEGTMDLARDKVRQWLDSGGVHQTTTDSQGPAR